MYICCMYVYIYHTYLYIYVHICRILQLKDPPSTVARLISLQRSSFSPNTPLQNERPGSWKRPQRKRIHIDPNHQFLGFQPLVFGGRNVKRCYSWWDSHFMCGLIPERMKGSTSCSMTPTTKWRNNFSLLNFCSLDQWRKMKHMENLRTPSLKLT